MVVVGERERGIDLVGPRPNLHRDAELVERTHRLGIEIGDRLGFERDPTGAAVTGSDVQPVLDEVELEVEDARFVWDRGRGQTTRTDVEGDLPPVVDHRRVRESDLADDLGPHVQRVTEAAHSSTRNDGQFRDDAALSGMVSVIRPSFLPVCGHRRVGAAAAHSFCNHEAS